MDSDHWRKCASCRTPIQFSRVYQKCSVSTCRKNVYCSVKCWDVHVPVMNHKSAWAEEETAPSRQEWQASGAGEESESTPRRRIVVSGSKGSSSVAKGQAEREILIVASKLKAYVKAAHDMNTSGNVMEKLSDVVRNAVDDAIGNAREEGRKTLMDRDF